MPTHLATTQHQQFTTTLNLSTPTTSQQDVMRLYSYLPSHRPPILHATMTLYQNEALRLPEDHNDPLFSLEPALSLMLNSITRKTHSTDRETYNPLTVVGSNDPSR